MRDSPHRRWSIGTGSPPPFVHFPFPLAAARSHPGKNAMFRAQAPHLPYPVVPLGFAVHVPTRLDCSAFYAISPPQGGRGVRRLARFALRLPPDIPSQVLPLPSASAVSLSHHESSRYSHRELPPITSRPCWRTPIIRADLRESAQSAQFKRLAIMSRVVALVAIHVVGFPW